MEIRSLEAGDHGGWQEMFEGYCEFYKVAVSAQKSDAVWAWLQDPDHMLEAIVAVDDGQIVGLAHFHGWPDSLDGKDTCYLADLFVDPEQRGRKIGKALFERVMEISKENGWTGVSLLTHKTNEIGQNLYDQYGEATDYLFYVSEFE